MLPALRALERQGRHCRHLRRTRRGAGIFKAADFLDVSEADFDAVLRVNLKGSFLVGQAVARAMCKTDARQSIGGSP